VTSVAGGNKNYDYFDGYKFATKCCSKNKSMSEDWKSLDLLRLRSSKGCGQTVLTFQMA